MPRVKTLVAEIGTTGTVERFTLSGNAADDIGRAVELEHPCTDDTSCDIAAALRAGCPFSAAYLLSGATETPLLDSVCQFYGFNPFDMHGLAPEDWTDWKAFHEEHGRECHSCGSFTYGDDFEPEQCGNCLATFPPKPDSDCDAFISESRDGYSVTVEGKTIASGFDTERRAMFHLWNWTRDNSFYPEAWSVNERGNTTLLRRTNYLNDPYVHTDIGYV
jgi:hypothetical protein